MTDLTLEDLAALFNTEVAIDFETQERMAEAIRRHPRYAQDVEKLEGMARYAGVPLTDGLLYHRRFERLPADVLDADDVLGVVIDPLVRIARARAGRGESPSRMRRIEQCLERARLEATR